MKYIKLFENKEKKIELIGYPEGNIIRVTKDELEELTSGSIINPTTGEEIDVRWDDEPPGQWRFMNDEEEELEEWLEDYRMVRLTGIDDPDAIDDIRKYNL